MDTVVPPPLEARSPRLSQTEMTEIVLPQHANAIGTAFGGTILSWIDICAAVVAQRHCGQIAVTAAIDEVTFRVPIRIGDVLRIRGWINAAFRSSLEVQVQVEREIAGTLTFETSVDAYLTFVCLNELGKPSAVPPVDAQSELEIERQRGAEDRRQQRLARRSTRT